MEQTATPRLGPPADGWGAARHGKGGHGPVVAWLLAGISWGVISLVILQFDAASITTVGVLVGVDVHVRRLSRTSPRERAGSHAVGLGAIRRAVLIAAVICFISPENTFAALADTLGFLFLLVGLWWIVRAFLERAINPLWWLGLISGILMTILAFWTGGQFFIEKAYVLLVFAGSGR